MLNLYPLDSEYFIQKSDLSRKKEKVYALRFDYQRSSVMP